MKKFFLSLLTLLGVGTAANALTPEFQLGYGGYTQMDVTDMHQGSAVNNAWGALTAGVNFDIAPSLKAGISYTFSSASYKHVEDANCYYHVIMANLRYDYYRNRIVTFYGHAALGADITHMTAGDWSKNEGSVAYQLSPFGAEVGVTPKCAMFGEIGYGAQGLLQVGVRLKL